MASVWQRFGLVRNPFFQEPLEEGATTADLRRLFVARATDVEQLTALLTHDEQTRVAMVGEPGVGKTTMINRLVADLRAGTDERDPWLVPELKPINLPAATTHVDFCIEVLGQVLDLRRQSREQQTKQRRRPGQALDAVSRAARQARAALLPGEDLWEVVTREVHGATTVAPQVAGFGLAAQRTPQAANVARWVPLTLGALAALVEESGQDVLLTINNAENLARVTAERAQDVLLDARDLFLAPHVHWLLVGTPDLFEQVIAPRRQLAGVIQHPYRLEPLGPDDVAALLTRRYQALRDAERPFTPPIAPEDAATLSKAFVGDLRELLRALEAAVLRAAPLGVRTLPLADAMGTISQQQRELLRERMDGAAWANLVRVALGPDAASPLVQRFREADAVRRLAPMTQPGVHQNKKQWLADGLVRGDGRSGNSAWLTLTGEALLAMLPELVAQGKPLDAILSGRDLERDPLPDQPPTHRRRPRKT